MVGSYFKSKLFIVKLKPSLLLNSSLCTCPLTYLTNEVLRLVATARQFIRLLLWIIWHQLRDLCLACTTRCVTVATPIKFIDGNKLKSCKTDLTNHTQLISYPWVLMPSGWTHKQTDTHTDAQTKIISRNQGKAAFG